MATPSSVETLPETLKSSSPPPPLHDGVTRIMETIMPRVAVGEIACVVRSAKLRQLWKPSDEEKKLWHTHLYEVKSGVLFLPGVPGPVQRADMEKVVKMYGKTIHFWQGDRGDPFPLGLPQVMMALTRDGQLYDNLAQDVEKRYNISYAQERKNREYMEGPVHGIHPKANGGGNGLKTVLREIECKPVESVPRVFV